MPVKSDDLADVRDRALSATRHQLRQIQVRIWGNVRPKILGVVVRLMTLYRLTIRDVVFIGVTGSVGKTSTKEMIAEVLSSTYKGHKSLGTNNVLKEEIRSILRTRRDDDYCVQEFGIGGLGEAVSIEKQFRMFKPLIGVVTTVGDDHIIVHGSREAIAAEKGKLIDALPTDGTAVLNADDPLVLAMRARCKGRTLTYGLSSAAMVRGEDIRDDWPNRLALTVRHGDESVRVQTQLCGAHLVSSVLGAIAVGQAMGVSLQSAAAALEGLAPVPGRMFPVEMPDGVTFICDDVKAPVWTIPAALDFIRRANAPRKVIIMGMLSDYQEPLDPTYARVARQALEAADHVLFVGRWASRALRAKRHPGDQAVQAFVTVDHLNEYLDGFLRSGDLVLIKGSRTDRLSRVVTTWKQRPSGPRADLKSDPDTLATPGTLSDASAVSNATRPPTGVNQLVVGLGNPGKRFEKTPHNVGQHSLDVLAEVLEATWSKEEFGFVARAEVHDQKVLLVKLATEMNRTGPCMKELADREALDPQDCVIIHDDINLKPGVVRNRMGGSSGGHKGMQSIIAAFQSEDLRRVKIGVGLPPEGTTVTRYVLTPFNASDVEEIDGACQVAATRILEMIKAHAIASSNTKV